MPAAEFQLIVGILAGEQVDKFRRARFFGAAGIGVCGNDGLAERLERLVLLRREKFRSIDARRGGGLLRCHHVVRVFGGLRRNHPQH